jgi:hypothetical protein
MKGWMASMEEQHNDGLWLNNDDYHTTVDQEGTMFYGPLDFFDQRPFALEEFHREQTFLLERVTLALASMEEDIEEMERGHELLSSTFQINVWRKLITQLEGSITCNGQPEELERCILQCALTFFRELFDPKRSIQQLNYLLRMRPDEPEHWGFYGLCLIEMAEQGLRSSFDMEMRSVHCFLRAARLSLAHLLARDEWFEKNGREETLRIVREYYYNASDAYPNIVSRRGMLLSLLFSQAEELPTRETIAKIEPKYEDEDLSREMEEILNITLTKS